MKKFTLLLAGLLLASIGLLSAQNLVLENQNQKSSERATLKHNAPQTRDDVFLTYYDLELDALAIVSGWSFTNANTYHISGCISFTSIQMAHYVGGVLHTIIVPLPQATHMMGLTTTKVWIKGSLSGAVLYEQELLSPELGDFNIVELTTPYTITAGELVIGYTTTHTLAAQQVVRPLWFEDGSEHAYEPGGCNYMYSTSATGHGAGAKWMQNTDEGNFGIIGLVSGVELPANDLSAVLVTTNTTFPKYVAQQYPFKVSVKNIGTASQNNYTVQLIDGNDNVLASQQVTSSLAPGETRIFNFNYAFLKSGVKALRGKVILASDEYNANDISEEVTNVIIYTVKPMSYCIDSDDGEVGTGNAATLSAVIEYKQADMGTYTGNKLTAVDIYMISNVFTNCSVWVRNTKTGTNIASKTFTPMVGWNRIELTTPLLLEANKDYFIGYTISTPSTVGYPIPYCLNSPANMVTGGNIAIGTAWYELTTVIGKSGNLLIVGAVEGACDAVTDLEVVYNDDNCNAELTWTAPAGATKFNVYRGTTLIAEEIETTSFTDEGNNYAQGYTWKVTVACTAGGESSPAFAVLGPCVEKPAAVKNLVINYEDCNAVLTWTPSEKAKYYKISRGTTLIADSVAVATYTDTENNPILGYTWSVKAFNLAGESAATNATKPACIDVPAAVTNFNVVYDDSCTFARGTWTPTTSNIAIGYTIYRDGVQIQITDIIEEPFFEDSDFENVGHTWSVKVLCDYGVESAPATKTLETCVIDEIKNNVKTAFSIVPNPATNNITVTAGCNFHTIEFVSFLGQTVLSQPNVGNTTKIDVSELSNGIYFVRIISETGTSVQKFVKQ